MRLQLSIAGFRSEFFGSFPQLALQIGEHLRCCRFLRVRLLDRSYSLLGLLNWRCCLLRLLSRLLRDLHDELVGIRSPRGTCGRLYGGRCHAGARSGRGARLFVLRRLGHEWRCLWTRLDGLLLLLLGFPHELQLV